MDPGFIHYHIPTQKIRFISAKQLQTALGINDTFLFLIRRERIIAYTLPYDIFKVSAISRNFNLRFSKTIWWTFLMVSGVTTSFGWPERSASSVSVRPRLNSAYHRQMVVFDGAESP